MWGKDVSLLPPHVYVISRDYLTTNVHCTESIKAKQS